MADSGRMTGEPEATRPVRLTEATRYTSRYTRALSMMYFQCLAVPSVLFHVVESTDNPLLSRQRSRVRVSSSPPYFPITYKP
jgi:hypothetical protein